jgi:hypothetical protein
MQQGGPTVEKAYGQRNVLPFSVHHVFGHVGFWRQHAWLQPLLWAC